MKAYYNEIDPYAAQWLRNLIKAGQIASGEVDERDIWDVTPDDLVPYDRCHFFAGIAGWDYALQLAEWPQEWSVWTGSCPCQPFSAAGKRGKGADERHLWPAWFHLIRVCRPPIIFGEQVASKDGLKWLDLVCADLETEGYSIGAADLCAASVGAPHIRQRLWFVALGNANSSRPERHRLQPLHGAGQGKESEPCASGPSPTNELADSDKFRLQIYGKSGDLQRQGTFRSDSEVNPWEEMLWLPCRDGKARPTEPGLFPLAHGVPARVGRLRAYGNAIVPQVAAEFIKVVIEFLKEAEK